MFLVCVVGRYWDQTGVTVNVAKAKDPLIGKIVSVARMVGPNAPGETCNIVIDHQGEYPLDLCAPFSLAVMLVGV